MHSFGLKQFIKCSTRVTCNSSSILACFPDRVSQSGIIVVGISDKAVNTLHQKNCNNLKLLP